MRYALLLCILTLLLGGCGGGGAASSAAGGSSGGSSGGSTAIGKTGVALDVTVKRTAARGEALNLATADDVQEVLIDFLDPTTLEKIRPTTVVARTAPTVDVVIDVPVGTWLMRIQGRTLTGEVAGSRYEQIIVVVEGQTTEVAAELDPITNLASIQVAPGPNALLAQGTTGQFTATGVFTDLTTQNLSNQVQWTSSNPAVANVSVTGLVLAVSNGTTVISARSGNVTGSSTLTVTPTAPTALQLTPATSTLSPGLTRQLTATAVFADNTNQNVTAQTVWVSSAPNVATVSNTGLVTAVAAGNATIRGTFGNLTGTATIAVSPTLTRLELTPSNVVVPVGSVQTVRATGVFSDNTTQDLTASVTWSTANGAVATVSSSGQVTGVAVGNTSVTAASGNVTATASVRVEPVVLLRLTVSPSSATIPKGATRNFTATGTFSNNSTRDVTSEVTWTSTNTSTVAISNANGTQGLATGVNAGQAVIEATLDGISQPASVNVTPATLVSLSLSPVNPEVGSGDLVQFRATGAYSDGTSLDLTTNVTWTSGNANVVVISNAAGTEGQATSTANGTTTITAASGNVTASTGFTTKAPPIPPPSPTPTPTPPITTLRPLYAQGGGAVKLYANATTVDGTATPSVSSNLDSAGGMTLDVTRNLLYCGNGTTVVRFNPATGLASNVTLNVPGAVQALAVDSTNDILYVSDGQFVVKYPNASTQTDPPAGEGSIENFSGTPGMVVDTVNDRLYVSNNGEGRVRFYNSISTYTGKSDFDTYPLGGSFISPLNDPQGIFIDPAANELWVAASGTSQVRVYNSPPVDSDAPPKRTIDGLFNPAGVFVDLDNNVLYVGTNTADGQVRIYNDANTLNGPAPAPSRVLDPLMGNIRNIIVDLTH